MEILDKYARLLVHYCLEIRPGDRLLIRSTTLAEPLVREVFREAVRSGAVVYTDLAFDGQGRILLEEGREEVLDAPDIFYAQAMEHFDAFLAIQAPFNLKELTGVPADRIARRQAALQPAQSSYFKRIADRTLRRSLCLYPTHAQAQEAGMSLDDYRHFVYNACCLWDEDPVASWLEVRKHQQHMVDVLNAAKHVHYVGTNIDLQFSTEGRTWINSDGRNNMPSGEVFTSPVEDSVQGWVHFTFPGLYQGAEVRGVRLEVRDGFITSWDAASGKEHLDKIFAIEGTRRFGEAAIGTNRRIDRMTRNILFDEKIGGTIHLAIGQSYLQCGGRNTSTVHWDMITDMAEDGRIYADGKRVYEKGHFVG